MVFTFQENRYAYAYRPDVGVFARAMTVGSRNVIAFKLVIDDKLYDVARVR